MAKVTMTLAEALVKKKTYESKIESLTTEISLDSRNTRRFIFCDYVVGTKKSCTASNLSEEDFSTYVNSNINRIMAIIRNYETLCMAINKKNNETIVNIGGKDMTIVEAIALKNGLVKDFRLSFARKLLADFNEIQKQVNKINEKVNDQDKINDYLDSVLTDETKKDPEAVMKAEETYHLMRDAKFIDPIGIQNLYDEIVQSDKAFKDEVNFRLSEINAKTEIEVEFED